MITTFSANILCMRQQLSITPLSPLPTELVKDILDKSCHCYKTSKEFYYGITCMSLLNKAHHSHINNPNTIRSIINSIPIGAYNSRGALIRGNIMSPIKMTGITNYILQSETLCENINKINIDTIKKLVYNGADVNYFHTQGSEEIFPPIYKIDKNYEKTKLLLELGFDINFNCRLEGPLARAIRKQNIDMIKLFITYKPHYKYLIEAIQTKNPEIIQLILQQEDIPLEKIKEGKKIAHEHDDIKVIKFLNAYKPHYKSLKEAVGTEDPKCVELILQQEDISIDEIKEGIKDADNLGNEDIRDLLYKACLDKIIPVPPTPTDINDLVQYYKNKPQHFGDIIRLLS